MISLFSALILLAAAPAHAGDTIVIGCSTGSANLKVTLAGDPAGKLTLKDELLGLTAKQEPAYIDEAMIAMEVKSSPATTISYAFGNLAACVDGRDANYPSLLVVSEKLDVLRPIAAYNCTCTFN